MKESQSALALAACLALVGCDSSPGTDAGGADASVDAGTDGGMCLTGAGDSLAGGACNCQMDCTPGLVCEPESGTGGPRGTCTALCTTGGSECGAGGVCDELVGTTMGICRQGCADHSECRDGWACFWGACSPHCTLDGECLSGTCDDHTNGCHPSDPMLGGVLAPCTRDDECRSGACLTDLGGYCFTDCVPALEDCPDGGICIAGIDPTDPGVGVCLLPCTSSTECPGMLSCLRASDGRTACWRAAP